jgi:hypothetical protein
MCTPKDLGGLGILDLDRFARALRLRWQWHRWKSTDKPWATLDIPCDNTDRDLFNSSTIVRVGRGNKAIFGTQVSLTAELPNLLLHCYLKKPKRKKHNNAKGHREQ